MLVLTRRLGQKVRIGDSVFVTVKQIWRQKVRLGIEAPADVPILRTELLLGEDSDLDANSPDSMLLAHWDDEAWLREISVSRR